MTISIITATFNSAATIADCITSVNNQSWNDIEQIIIDGASVDNTIKIAKSIPNRITKIISEPDKGIYYAMNKGISLAKGDIIGILNSDDFLASNDIIETIVKTFNQEKCDAIYGNLVFVSANNSQKIIRGWKSSEYVKGSFSKGWHPPHPTFYVVKRIYNNYGGFDVQLNVSADFELMLRFIEKYQINTVYIDRTIVIMRYGGEATGSIRNILKGNQNILKAFRKNNIKVSLVYSLFRILSKIEQFFSYKKAFLKRNIIIDSNKPRKHSSLTHTTFESPSVSIILPAYNSIKFIEDTLNSIINQEYPNWELLITDDCSNDGTWEILNEYAKKDKRIKLYRLKNNAGAGVARNNSINNAKGRFIAFCDSDDQWKSDKLEKQLKFMIDNNLPLSYTSYDLIDENNSKKGKVKAPEKITYKKMIRNNYIGCLTAMYDTEKLGKVFMPEIRKRQDWAFWLVILKKIPYARGMQENLAIYRKRGKSVSSSKFDLLKYNWYIYRKEEKFSLAYSSILLTRFLYYYFIKKLK